MGRLHGYSTPSRTLGWYLQIFAGWKTNLGHAPVRYPEVNISDFCGVN